MAERIKRERSSSLERASIISDGTLRCSSLSFFIFLIYHRVHIVSTIKNTNAFSYLLRQPKHPAQSESIISFTDGRRSHCGPWLLREGSLEPLVQSRVTPKAALLLSEPASSLTTLNLCHSPIPVLISVGFAFPIPYVYQTHSSGSH